MRRFLLLFLSLLALQFALPAAATTISIRVDGEENRIEVLRGLAAVLLREIVTARSGSGDARDRLDSIVTTVGLEEIPELLSQLRMASSNELVETRNTFTRLGGSDGVSPETARQFKKDSERLLGTLSADQLLLQAFSQKINAALETATNPETRNQLTSYQQMVTDTSRQLQTSSAELDRMVRFDFRPSPPAVDTGATELQNRLAAISEVLGGIQSQLAGEAGSLSQDWFRERIGDTVKHLEELGALSQWVQSALETDPSNPELQAIQRAIQQQQNQSARLLRSLAVVEISPATLVRMQEMSDLMSDVLMILLNETEAPLGENIDRREAYIAEQNRRVAELLRQAKALYDEISARLGSHQYITAEQAEFLAIYERFMRDYASAQSAIERFEARAAEYRAALAEQQQGNDVPPIQHVDDIVLPVPFGQYDHLSWGEWNEQGMIPHTLRTANYWIAGSLTPAAAIPVGGTATYTGEVLGKLNEAGIVSQIGGSSTLTADFAARTLTGGFDMTKNGAAWTTATVNANWPAAGNQINGTIQALQMQGTVDGRFFGPAANALGGTWSMSDNDGSATGIFVGKR